ncbi:MAG: stkP 4 [Planctomycetota bacterium]|nr:stkP 4 [Planctomycetota bacterium]
MKVILKVTGGPHQGQSFAFGEHDTFVVGRSDSAQFRLPFKDKTLSRVHFLVEVNPPSCRLMDMASTNGTFVNGKKVSTIDLNDGDTIRGGRTHIEVHFEEDDAPVTRGVEPVADYGIESVTVDDVGPRLPTLPKLTLETELGRGGMGVVYRAKNAQGETVAVKTITPAAVASEGVTARFLREAGILRTLDHPGIVKFREIGHADSLVYFVMDYVPGKDADWVVRQDQPLPIARAVGIATQMLDALSFAHAKGFVHRDVKPKNLLVSTEGGRDTVKLADFGLARLYLDSPLSGLSFTGQIAGTYGYMSPEQITHFREAKPPADLYAAAATLYFLLTAKRVYDFPRNVERQLLMILQDEPVPIRERRPDVPEGLAKVIHRSLKRDPKERFADAAEMRKALKPFAAGAAVP